MNTASVQSRTHIGEVVLNAVAFDFKNWRGASTCSMEPLLEAVAQLFEMLRVRRIDYVLVGGIAMLQYIEGRNTQDIDLIIALADLKKLPEIEIKSQDDDFARGDFKGLQIDFLLSRNPLFQRVQKGYSTTQPFIEQSIPTATVEGLLILKMFALPALYRMGNFARVGLYENDIATLLNDYRPPTEPLLDELKPHLSPGDFQSVREIVREIEERIARFNRGRETSE